VVHSQPDSVDGSASRPAERHRRSAYRIDVSLRASAQGVSPRHLPASRQYRMAKE